MQVIKEEHIEDLLIRLSDLFNQEKERVRIWEANATSILDKILVSYKIFTGREELNSFYSADIGSQIEVVQLKDEEANIKLEPGIETEFNLGEKRNFPGLKIELLSDKTKTKIEKFSVPYSIYINNGFKEEHGENIIVDVPSVVKVEDDAYLEDSKDNMKAANKYLFKCIKCPHQTASKLDYNNHLLESHEEQTFQCSRCNFSTTVQKNMDIHDKYGHKPLQKAICSRCNLTLPSRKELKAHSQKAHAKPVVRDGNKERMHPCSQCKFNTYRISELDRHVRAVHDKIKNSICHSCDYKTARSNELKRHIRFYHDKIYDHICEHCNYKAITKEKLRKHIKAIHEKIKDEQCHLCPVSFASRYNLQGHIKSVHEKLKQFHCPKCPYETNRRGKMNAHTEKSHQHSEGNKQIDKNNNYESFNKGINLNDSDEDSD